MRIREKNDTRGALVSDGGIGGTCSRFFMLVQLYHAEMSKKRSRWSLLDGKMVDGVKE